MSSVGTPFLIVGMVGMVFDGSSGTEFHPGKQLYAVTKRRHRLCAAPKRSQANFIIGNGILHKLLSRYH